MHVLAVRSPVTVVLSLCMHACVLLLCYICYVHIFARVWYTHFHGVGSKWFIYSWFNLSVFHYATYWVCIWRSSHERMILPLPARAQEGPTAIPYIAHNESISSCRSTDHITLAPWYTSVSSRWASCSTLRRLSELQHSLRIVSTSGVTCHTCSIKGTHVLFLNQNLGYKHILQLSISGCPPFWLQSNM